MKSRFKFLKTDFPDLAENCKNAEKYCTSDPTVCMMYLGKISEYIVNYMIDYHKIQLSHDSTIITQINALKEAGFLSLKQSTSLHDLRKARNKAVHSKYNSVDGCTKHMDKIYGLCVWFKQQYGTRNYETYNNSQTSRQQQVSTSGYQQQASTGGYQQQASTSGYQQQNTNAKPCMDKQVTSNKVSTIDFEDLLVRLYALVVLGILAWIFWDEFVWFFGGVWYVIKVIGTLILLMLKAIWYVITVIGTIILWMLKAIWYILTVIGSIIL